MKQFYIIISLLTSNLIFAAGWTPTGSYVNSATDYADIKKIIDSFPEIMDNRNFSISDIRSLQVSLISLAYEGETICPQNDERLSYNHFSYFVCLKNQQGPCIDYFDEFKADTDPCLEN